MKKKAVSKTLWILITTIVVLVVAVTVLSIFSGGTKWISNIFAQWSGHGDACEFGCNSWRTTNCLGEDAESKSGIICSNLPGCESTGICSCTQYCE